MAASGPNGSGKTNLLEAVSFLSPGRGLRRASADEVARRAPDLGDEGVGWRVQATLAGDAGEREVETGAGPGEARSVRVDGKAATQTDLARVTPVLWLVPAMDRLWIEGAEGRRRFLDRATLSFFPAHADASLAYDKAMRERNRLLRDGSRDARWFAALEAQMARAGVEVARARAAAVGRLLFAQGKAETAFPAATLAIAHPEEPPPEDVEEFARALERGRWRDVAAGRSLLGPHRADLLAAYAAKGVPAADCSTGEQKALLVSIILANARTLVEEDAGPLLLLDEVAAHLDPARRAALYDEVVGLGAHALMTATEKSLYAELAGRAQYLDVTEEGGVSEARDGPPP